MPLTNHKKTPDTDSRTAGKTLSHTQLEVGSFEAGTQQSAATNIKHSQLCADEIGFKDAAARITASVT